MYSLNGRNGKVFSGDGVVNKILDLYGAGDVLAYTIFREIV